MRMVALNLGIGLKNINIYLQFMGYLMILGLVSHMFQTSVSKWTLIMRAVGD